MYMDLFFDHYFNFFSGEAEINKIELNLINLDWLETLKDNYMVPDWKLFWDWYDSKSALTFFEATFSYFSIMAAF